uniref:Prolyl 4-hydroxylase alpha subunit domain-containing protein n=1 Tax=Aegilops tauschii TaxID=37682 RepID=N1R0K7_AEGTA
MARLLLVVLALHLTAARAFAASSVGGRNGDFDPSRVVQLSWHPRAFLHKGFLSDAECDHMIELAKDKLEKSMVADNESGKSVQSEVRTSSGMFLEKRQKCDIGPSLGVARSSTIGGGFPEEHEGNHKEHKIN